MVKLVDTQVLGTCAYGVGVRVPPWAPTQSETMDKELEKKLEKLIDKVDKLQSTIDRLDVKLSKHIGFIDETYEGLKNPINTARKFFGR